MAYSKTRSSLISRPIPSGFGGAQESLGVSWSDVTGAAGKVVDFYGAGLKAQGGQEALAAQLAAQNAAAKAPASDNTTTYLLIGGVAVVGLLVFMMRRK
jgi:hypothetical protein